MLRVRPAPSSRSAGGFAIARGPAAAAGYGRVCVVERQRARHKPGPRGPGSRPTSYAKSVADPPRGIALSERVPSHHTKAVADPRLGIVVLYAWNPGHQAGVEVPRRKHTPTSHTKSVAGSQLRRGSPRSALGTRTRHRAGERQEERGHGGSRAGARLGQPFAREAQGSTYPVSMSGGGRSEAQRRRALA